MYDLMPCGTYAAYKRHQRRGEPADDACRAASARMRRRYPSYRHPTGRQPGRPPAQREYAMGEWELLGGPRGGVDFHEFAARIGTTFTAWSRLFYRARELGDPRAVRPLLTTPRRSPR